MRSSEARRERLPASSLGKDQVVVQSHRTRAARCVARSKRRERLPASGTRGRWCYLHEDSAKALVQLVKGSGLRVGDPDRVRRRCSHLLARRARARPVQLALCRRCAQTSNSAGCCKRRMRQRLSPQQEEWMCTHDTKRRRRASGASTTTRASGVGDDATFMKTRVP